MSPFRDQNDRMPASPLSVEFRAATEDQAFAEYYVTQINWPGIAHPVERHALYRTDYETLAKAGSIVALGTTATGEVACGLYIIIDGADIAWMCGVRVIPSHQAQGFGSILVHAALDFIRDRLGITRVALTVRCDDAGSPLPTPFKTYNRSGFRTVGEPFPVTISGLPCDCHMGDPGCNVLSLRMEWTA